MAAVSKGRLSCVSSSIGDAKSELRESYCRTACYLNSLQVEGSQCLSHARKFFGER